MIDFDIELSIECFRYKKSFDTKIAIVDKTKVFLKLIGRPKLIEYAAYFSQMCFRTNF